LGNFVYNFNKQIRTKRNTNRLINVLMINKIFIIKHHNIILQFKMP